MRGGLVLDRLSAGYGGAVVLEGLTLTLAPGEAVAVLGRNGAGKTTLIDSIIGLTRRFGGRVVLDGRDLTPAPPEVRARAGIGWVPQQRRVFPSLTVEENLTVAALPGPWRLASVYAMFPQLQARRANRGNALSGGEQQMLAIGRALMLNPRILLLDEPTEGLAPIVAGAVLDAIAAIGRSGMAVLVVEQQPGRILRVTDRALILDRGRIVLEGPSAALLADRAALAAHLGVVARAPSPAGLSPPLPDP